MFFNTNTFDKLTTLKQLGEKLNFMRDQDVIIHYEYFLASTLNNGTPLPNYPTIEISGDFNNWSREKLKLKDTN